MAKTKAQVEQELALAKAEVEALKLVQDNVIREVLDYDGCYEGKVEFLETCGIKVPEQNFSFTATVHINVEGLRGVSNINLDDIKIGVEEQLQSTLENDFNQQTSHWNGNACIWVDGDDRTVESISGDVVSIKAD